MATSKHDSALCATYNAAIDLLGKRWTGMILRVLIDKPVRFAQLRSELGAISERVLSERLKELEASGILTRNVEPGPPVRVAYALTEKGRALGRVLDEIGKWAEKWIELPGPKRRAP